MRVAIVLNTSWNIYNFRLNFIRRLLREGHEIHTVAPRDRFTEKLEALGCVHHDSRMDSRGVNPLKDFALIIELLLIYSKIKPAVVLQYTVKPNVYGTIAASILRIPVINNVCGLGTVFLKSGMVSKVAIFLYRISFRYAAKVFFQNPEDLKLFTDKKLVPETLVDILPGSGIDLEKFPFVEPEMKDHGKFTFLLVARLIKDKGIFEYIEAIKILKKKGVDAKFQLLGAVDREHLRSISRETLLRWVREGWIEYLGTTEDVRSYLQAADCVVLPSYREGTPRTLLEAASMGKVIVASDVPGCRQVVDHGVNGLLCRMKDSQDLADKMEILSKMPPDVIKNWGLNGRIKMEKEFNESRVIDQYLTVMKAITLQNQNFSGHDDQGNRI